MNPIELQNIVRQSLADSASYDEYVAQVEALVEEQKTSGPKQTEDLVYYTRLNAQRSKRINKTVSLPPELHNLVMEIDTPQTWLVLSESWCGDAAQILPLLYKIADVNDLVSFRIVFRDEHLALMDKFLTNGGRSIPKLIILDEELEVLGTWGPRPKPAQTLYDAWRNDPDKAPYKEFQVELQKWYLTDRGQSTFLELSELLDEIIEDTVEI